MSVALILVVLGLVLLTFAADRFVDAAIRLATIWGLSPILIGAVVVGMGTSMPELLVSLTGGLESFDLAVGNITGSNIANLSLVLGAAAILSPISGSKRVVPRQGILSLAAMAVFAGLLALGNGLSRTDGVILLVAMALAMWKLFAYEKGESISGGSEGGNGHRATPAVLQAALWLIVMSVGARILTFGATDLAGLLGLAEGYVGETIVAIGTSLPELAAAIAAARKKAHDLILGNLLGSNIFNSLLVGGGLALVAPGTLSIAPTRTMIFMLVTGVLAGVFAFRNALSKTEGAVLLAVFAAFLATGL
jgi:cation:H+ antiporter